MKNNELSLFEFNEKDNINKFININKDIFLSILNNLEEVNNIDKIKKELLDIIQIIKNPNSDNYGLINITNKGDMIKYNTNIILNEINTILKSQTIERIYYYIKRLKKSILEVKTNGINDINLNNWKEYDDIITDSLWILHKRDNSGSHNAKYWGNFIPQIPNQFLRRYTKQNEWVLDPFL